MLFVTVCMHDMSVYVHVHIKTDKMCHLNSRHYVYAWFRWYTEVSMILSFADEDTD